jgi:hypothetical protein
MDYFMAQLIDLVAQIWRADSDVRDRSIFGESEMERQSRRFVAWLCGSIIFLLVVGGVVWWWFVKK